MEPSGPQWTKRFPGSVSLDDLKPAFAANVRAFLAALREADATVRIAATYRPPERAWLMHWCWLIANGKIDPAKVPAMKSVEIDWQHKTDAPDPTAAREAAAKMSRAYNIRYAPALVSRHTQRRAVDMSIAWQGPLALHDASGKPQTIATSPRTGQNHQLIEIAKTFGVIKLPSDPPHWSDDGH